MKIAILFVGEIHDQGFNASALEGAERARHFPGADIRIVEGVAYDPAAMERAAQAAIGRADALVFVGGQGNRIMPRIAQAHPHKAFAIVQGEVTGPNLASYDVLQEESAFLAGVLAARMTATGIVGHLSGHRVAPGLKGRAAFVAGVAHADASVRVLTGFCGTQDDNAIARAWTDALAGQGADIVFTMLNGARRGAIDACRARNIRQIGNATDWCAVDPRVFIASALAGIDLGVERAVRDLLAGARPSRVVSLGLAATKAIGLTLADDVPDSVAAQVSAVAEALASGAVKPRLVYDGPEFEPATVG